MSDIVGDSGPEEGWVVCRVFKKKNYHKALESPSISILPNNLPRNDGGVLDHILTYMGRSSSPLCKQENDSSIQFPDQSPAGGFMHLPALDHASTINHPSSSPSSKVIGQDFVMEIGPSSDWAAMDRLVASQLNGGQPSDDQIFSYGEPMNDEDFAFPFDHDDLQLMNMHDHRPSDHQHHHHHHHHYDHQVSSTSETGLWDFARSSSSLSTSSSDPLCHLSV